MSSKSGQHWLAASYLLAAFLLGSPEPLLRGLDARLTQARCIVLVGFGTSQSQSDRSWALLKEGPSNKEELFQESDSVFSLGRLKSVTPKGVDILMSDGRVLHLSLNGQGSSVTPYDATEDEALENLGATDTTMWLNPIPSSTADKFFASGYQNMSSLANRGRRGERIIGKDKKVGVEYDEVPPESLLAKLGVQPGDFIYGINSEQVLYSSDVFELDSYVPSNPSGTISLRVMRNGRTVELKTALE